VQKKKYKTDFSDYKAQKRAKGQVLLREWQMNQAKKGNISMLIWLGKQYLGQTDKADHTTGGEKIQHIEFTVASKETIEVTKRLIGDPLNERSN